MEKRSKNISYRVTPDEHRELTRFSDDYGGQKVDGILSAIRKYDKGKSTYRGSIDTAADIVTDIGKLRKQNEILTQKIKDVYEHPLVALVYSEGLSIHSVDGDYLQKINSLGDLLNFVQTKSLQKS